MAQSYSQVVLQEHPVVTTNMYFQNKMDLNKQNLYFELPQNRFNDSNYGT